MQIHHLGRQEYLTTYNAMQVFTFERNIDTPDQLWLCEHPPTFTLGLASLAEHLLIGGDIPVIQTNRGGQITYHGPGQVVAYPLLDLKRVGYFVKEYVYRIEEAVIRTLMHFGVTGHRVTGAPGIYVRQGDATSHARLPEGFHAQHLGKPYFGVQLAKIAALGVKVSRHCAYHGVALNVDMDLQPFSHINPCGFTGLATTDLARLGISVSPDDVAQVLGAKLPAYLASSDHGGHG